MGTIWAKSVDKDIIILGEKLSDQHMNFAQSLIKKKLEQLSGLHSTLSVSQMNTPVISGNVVQILHTGGDHWMLASNCPVGLQIHFILLFLLKHKYLLKRYLGMPPSCYHHVLNRVEAVTVDCSLLLFALD